MDVIHWLTRDEAFSGQASTEADIKIVHSRKQDVAWFYGTIFLAPALVIGAGVAVTRKTRRKRRQDKSGGRRGDQPAPPPPPTAPPAAGPPGGSP
jgi:hypothetical protein